MALPLTQKDNSSSITITTTTPLVSPQDQVEDPLLSKSLNCLETFLRVFGFCQYSFLSFSLSWLSFLLLGVAVPIVIIRWSECPSCEKYEISVFELQIFVFQTLVAVISLVCISNKLRKYGLRKFLFLDSSHGYVPQFRDEYLTKIKEFFYLLAKWILPCLLLKTAREVAHAIYVHNDSWWQSVVLVIAAIISWTYSSVLYLAGCALFNLVCNLQVIHFENFGKLLESDIDILLCIEEHIRLTLCLSKISHRFRVFFLFEVLVVTASQFVALVHTTGSQGIINLINGGDFAVASIVELAGIVICLHAASKTSHRAQGVASIATRWHSLVTCSTNGTSQTSVTSSSGNLDASKAIGSIPITYSESDLEAVDYVPVPTSMQMDSRESSYQKRQAFVMYLLSNPGGFTVFGWRIDRALISTIFFLELSLVLFVLGKNITLSK